MAVEHQDHVVLIAVAGSEAGHDLVGQILQTRAPAVVHKPAAPRKVMETLVGWPMALAALRMSLTPAPRETPGWVSKPTVAAGNWLTWTICRGEVCWRMVDTAWKKAQRG